MATAKNSEATQLLVAAAHARGYQVHARQVVRWTSKTHRIAPDVRLPLQDRIIDYYCQLSTLIQPRRDASGALANMAFRGYEDLIHKDRFNTVMVDLVRYRLGMPDDPDRDYETARTTIRKTRVQKTPERAVTQRALQGLPSTFLDGRTTGLSTDLVVTSQSERLLNGQSMDAGEIVAGTLYNAFGPQGAGIIHPMTDETLAYNARLLNGMNYPAIQDVVLSATMEEITGIARILYPQLAYELPSVLGFQPDRALIERGCMATACAAYEAEVSKKYLSVLAKATDSFAAQYPEYRPYTPGLAP